MNIISIINKVEDGAIASINNGVKELSVKVHGKDEMRSFILYRDLADRFEGVQEALDL